MNLKQRWNEYWFAPQSPFNLAVCRVLLYGFLFCFYALTPFAPWAELGPKSAFWQPLWLFKSMHFPAFSAPVILALEIIWKLSLLMACIGLLTRWVTPIAFLLGMYLVGLTFNYGKIEHATMPVIITLAIMAMSRCGDAMSVDRWISAARGKSAPAPSGEYRWPARVIWLLMSITFFAAGLAKLRYTGIKWALGDGFRNLMIIQHYQPNPPYFRWGLYIASVPWLARVFATGSLLTELCFPLALVNRRARWFFPLNAFAMQFGIGLIMNIWFTLFLPVYIFWVPWERLLTGRKAIAGHEPQHVPGPPASDRLPTMAAASI